MAQFEVRVEYFPDDRIYFMYFDTENEAQNFVNDINEFTDDFLATIME